MSYLLACHRGPLRSNCLITKIFFATPSEYMSSIEPFYVASEALHKILQHYLLRYKNAVRCSYKININYIERGSLYHPFAEETVILKEEPLLLTWIFHHVLESFVRFLCSDIRAFYESKEGQ